MFQKEKFRDCLLQARGKRTNETFSKESGVSRAYISAYLNLKRNDPPTPEIIRRLAKASKNNVTYENLMIAAGFLDENYYIDSSYIKEESSEKVYNNNKNIMLDDIESLSPESKKELEKYIQLLKLKDTLDKSKDEMSSVLMSDVSENK
jgi:transcriptional regulator with XRE-family HTH domain